MKWLGGFFLLLAVWGGNLLWRRRVIQLARRRRAWITLLEDTERQVECYGTPLDTAWRESVPRLRQLCCEVIPVGTSAVSAGGNGGHHGTEGGNRTEAGSGEQTVARFCEACRVAAGGLPAEEEQLLLRLCERCERGSTDRTMQAAWLKECRLGLLGIAEREEEEMGGRLRRCGMLSLCGTLAFLLLIW